MAQPSVAHYFNTRKRPAVDDNKIIDCPQKVLVLDEEQGLRNTDEAHDLKAVLKNKEQVMGPTKIATLSNPTTRKVVRASKTAKKAKVGSGKDIQTFLDNMKVPERCVTPPNDVQKGTETNSELNEIKKKLSKSSRLSELKASISRFKKSAEHLKVAEKKTAELTQLSKPGSSEKKVPESPKLKTFKSLEFEVTLSPQKSLSPEKPYLSPKKESSVRRNLLGALSPVKKSSLLSELSTKETLHSAGKQALKLPFKYRVIAEFFRAVDTVSQLLYNRKEAITLQKLKPAVEEILKKNLTPKHLAQINHLVPEAFDFRQEKLKVMGSGMRHGEWNLVIAPKVGGAESMTSEILLQRRRKMFEALIDLVKDYHNEFLMSLTPPMVIAKDKITRWHPEFDLEKVPDIEQSSLPEPPPEEKFTTGKEVLEKARQMFNCNTRMEQALAKLKAARETNPQAATDVPAHPTSILKGIPKALLEKVRQKQAAKALISMTRSADKDKEMQLYSRLPEIARLTRHLFVSEKKNVLQLDVVIEKLSNSYRCFLKKADMEEHLRAISSAVPDWLVFLKQGNTMFLKLAKNANLSVVLNKLEELAKEKSEA